MFHENWRFRSCRALRAEISAGTIGRPIRLRIARRDIRALREGGYDDQPYFRTLPRLTLLEMGCHLVDTARFLIGEVETVSAALASSAHTALARTWRRFHSSSPAAAYRVPAS
jgi:predicted dehydrogenase